MVWDHVAAIGCLRCNVLSDSELVCCASEPGSVPAFTVFYLPLEDKVVEMKWSGTTIKLSCSVPPASNPKM